MLMDVQEIALLEKVQEPVERQTPAGLGVPKINHVPSLMLFNSTDNVYKRYAPLDNLNSMASKPRKRRVDTATLSTPPESIVGGETMIRGKREITDWQPAPVAAMEHDFPAVLPLSNVANLNWVGKFAPINPSDNIAPSLGNAHQLSFAEPSSITITSDAPRHTDHAVWNIPSTQAPAPTSNSAFPISASQNFTPNIVSSTPNPQTIAPYSALHAEHRHTEPYAANPNPNPGPNPGPNLHGAQEVQAAHNRACVFDFSPPNFRFPDESTIPPPLNTESPQCDTALPIPPEMTVVEASPIDRHFQAGIIEGRERLRPTPRPIVADKNTPHWIARIEDIRRAVDGDDTASEASEDWEF
eukprot:Phypoly_transcript_07507.p1 GENE.Phypoly_transcript_07507~~Phypoly_transcript_07507.p1  ORF type:complete len:356 (+),score=55.16 Phypoly_transcript_07507:492-1559(+)